MATKRYSSVKGRVARLTRLDECGVPVIGAKSQLVTAGFIRVGLAFVYEDGEENQQKNAWGDYCYDEQDNPRLRRVDPTIDFCQVDPDAFEIATGARLLMDATDAAGWALNGDPVVEAFSLEVWSKVAGSGACAAGGQQYVYTALPFVNNGKLGDFNLELAGATFQIAGQGQGANAAWGDSPGSSNAVTGSTTTGSAAVTGVAGYALSAADVGRAVTGAGIPVGARILSVQSATAFTLTANATATGSGVALTLAAQSWLPGTEVALSGDRILQNVTTRLPPAETVGAVALT